MTLFSCENIFLTPLFNITAVLLAFNGFRHIHSAFRYNGIEGLIEFFWTPTFVFQLNVLAWSVYLSVVLLAYVAVKRYPDQIYSTISRDRLKAAGLNPNLSSHFKKCFICVGIGAGSALAVDLGDSALRTSTEHQAISANQQAVDQAHQNLNKGHITGNWRAQRALLPNPRSRVTGKLLPRRKTEVIILKHFLKLYLDKMIN